MNEELRRHIAETYDGGCWEEIAVPCWNEDGIPWKLYKFEREVEFDGSCWDCIIITKDVFTTSNMTDVEYSEDVFTSACEL